MKVSKQIKTNDLDELDRLFHALSNQTRRKILTHLSENISQPSDKIPLSAIIQESSAGDKENIALYHQHIPKLVDLGCIRWTRKTGMVQPGPAFDDINLLLTFCKNHEDELPIQWP